MYLQDLTIRLASGLGAVPARVRDEHARFLKAAQQPDGGFAGREGGSDLYYTSFALRGLSILGELEGEVAESAGRFLRDRLSGQETIVDFFSLIYGAALLDAAANIDIFRDAHPNWREQVAAVFAALRRPDGGYAKAAGGAASSTYHTFLVLLCYQLIERPFPDPQRTVDFVHAQLADGGGFREIRAAKRAGTNPTAAAIGTLRILESITDEVRESTLDFLVEMQSDEGGFSANTRIVFADILSTFTALLTIDDLGALVEIDIPPAIRYVNSMAQDDGGFLAFQADRQCDVEYTFYGLGCRALLADVEAGG